MLPDNAPVRNRVYGYLRVSFISTCASYVFNILLVIFPINQHENIKAYYAYYSLKYCNHTAQQYEATLNHDIYIIYCYEMWIFAL